MSVSSVHLRFCILLGAQTADYKKIKIYKYWISVSAMRRTSLSVIGIGSFLIQCIPTGD